MSMRKCKRNGVAGCGENKGFVNVYSGDEAVCGIHYRRVARPRGLQLQRSFVDDVDCPARGFGSRRERWKSVGLLSRCGRS